MIKGFLFDFGGVLMRTEDWTHRNRWEDRLGLARGSLIGIVTDNDASRKATLGLASEASIWGDIQQKFSLSPTELDEFIHDFWAGDRLDMRLLAYLAGLRPKYKTAVLSNAWTGMRTTFIERYQLDEWFDHLIISSEEGIAKPDPRIYRLAAARLRILPEEAVFVDDAPVNVLAAISLGMQGIQFGSADQVLSELNKITKISAADFKTD